MSKGNLNNGEFFVEQPDKIRIEDCTRLFKFLCPKKWENLQPTEREDVRFCNSCRKDVRLCTTLEEFSAHSGHCVALVVKLTEEEAAEEDRRQAMRYPMGQPRSYKPGPYDSYMPLEVAKWFLEVAKERATQQEPLQEMTDDPKED